jgi:3-deoxy-D-manno-octulosonic-acid transferase
VVATRARGIPLALVNARMNDAAFARRRRWRSLYADLFARFSLITAQDPTTAMHLKALGAKSVRVAGSLKAGAPPLAADPCALALAQAALAGRRTALLASSHPEDEAVVFAALQAVSLRPLLLLAPRDPARAAAIAGLAADHGLTATRRSLDEGPSADIWIVDTFGELGLWYRLCPVTLIGGTFGPTEGHNPWEPASLGSAILHGPHVANFASDFKILNDSAAALAVNAADLAQALNTDHSVMATRAKALSDEARGALGPLATELLALGGQV